MPAAGWTPADGAGPQGFLRGPQAQGPKAHADVRISNMSLILRSSELVGDTGRHPDRMIEHVAAMLSQALDELTRQGTTVPGIVLAHPGIIDYANDTVRYSSTLGRYDVALVDKVRDAIARRTGSGRDVPVITLENDAKLAALATYERYAPAGVRNLLYLSGGEGIDAGIIADGHLLRGWLGLTGEVGHMPVEPEGLLCRCGRRGCWETRSGLEARLLDRRAQVKVEVSHLGQWASSHGAVLVALEAVLDNPCLGADAHPQEATRFFLMSDRVMATADGPVSIDLLASWFADQVQPDTGCDVSRWWQAHDRTTGRELPITGWSLEADGRTVTVQEALAGHVYTVSFLATQVWDPIQMYNYLTNGWGDDPSRVREKPFDVRHEATWAHVRSHLSVWLSTHPEVDVVRFTTFFYHFTLVYGTDAAERYGEHFAATGIDAVVGSVSPGATCRMIADIPTPVTPRAGSCPTSSPTSSTRAATRSPRRTTAGWRPGAPSCGPLWTGSATADTCPWPSSTPTSSTASSRSSRSSASSVTTAVSCRTSPPGGPSRCSSASSGSAPRWPRPAPSSEASPRAD